ncbi:hypothetical protein SAMN05443144_12271 [Fodinibius roseus]|uniref:Uncharacterized protein n=1 Tax=Fodinibius roseus TaxID=1194090 RepID=A0A1M5I8U4_9BACT|nr:hypothetical protein [Fodinibius roseus]SHG24672.1 hypothetical protein SAMN05443144_12271 [Fodinibius roseus]
MSQSKGPGGCLVTLVILLVLLGLVGILDWAAVGEGIEWIGAFVAASLIVGLMMYLWITFFSSDEGS